MARSCEKRQAPYNEDTWRVFRIMAEFVDGFEDLSQLKSPAVTIFGSARSKENTPEYKNAREIANSLAKAGYTIITGGGPGAMEAANRGAKEADGSSVGLNIELPMEQCSNPYVNMPIGFRYFFVRKVMFLKYASAVIVMPGGLGTMDECFEVLTLIQTHKIGTIPVVLFGSSYWKGLLDWINSTMVDMKMVTKQELSMIRVMDDPKEVVKLIKNEVKLSTIEANF